MPQKSVTAPGPAWAGPCSPGPEGGVTVSLMQKALACRDRFRVLTIDGWRAAPRFCHRLFFGSAWHAAEEAYAKTASVPHAVSVSNMYAIFEVRRHPFSRDDVIKWSSVIDVTFPEYVAFWGRSPDQSGHVSVCQEQVFHVPYTLPSGRVVYLRGKRDGVTRDPDGRLWLFETKTKGEVDEVEIRSQLSFDLQTMTYLTALTLDPEYAEPVAGVRYNVIRRPLSGGKGTIVRHKPTKKNPLGETVEEYYTRLREYISDEPETYFFRWECGVGDGDVAAFRQAFLDPFLEFLCTWYESVNPASYCDTYPLPPSALTWRTPFGLTSQISDGYGSDVDRYLNTGSTVGLARVDTLFPELA